VRTLGIYCHALLIFGLVLVSAGAENLVIEEAGQVNVFLDDSRAQVHLLHRPLQRVIFAFPSGNSGVAFWYEGDLKLLPQSLKSLPDQDGQQITATFEVAEPTRVNRIILDNLRVIRAFSHGAPILEETRTKRGEFAEAHVLPESWARLRYAGNETAVRVERIQPGYGPYRLAFQSKNDVESTGKVIALSPGTVQVTVRCPFPTMADLPLEELLQPTYGEKLETLSPRERLSLESLSFLTSQETMMAGSWRFLTYFGRDTLISLSMLEPILSDRALLFGVQSVLRRLSPEGVVAHEEDVGSWAEWRHLNEEPPTYSLAPVYDYKMIDDDLLLPVVLHKLKEQKREDVLSQLFSHPESREALRRNADYVLEKLSGKEPLLLQQGEVVGEWRDSASGLGGGANAYSVNGILTVESLRSLEWIYGELGATDKRNQATELLPTFEEHASHFWREYSRDQIGERVGAYSHSLDKESRSALSSEWSEVRANLPDTLTVPILSFTRTGEPVEVVHSDVGFDLFYGDLSDQELERILTFLETPYPVGVVTPAGPIVANPILSQNPKHWKELGPGRYHGMVVWSWQSALLQFGLARQYRLRPPYRERIGKLLDLLEAGEEKAGALATSELWGVDFTTVPPTPRAYGEGGDQTESNAMQLWSTVYPALRHVITQLNR